MSALFAYLDRHPGACLAIVAVLVVVVGIIEAHTYPFA